MAASKDDYFKKVGRATATTLSSPGYTIGDSTINTGATTNWPVDTGVTFAIDEVGSDGLRISGTYNVFNGVVSGAGQVSQVEYIGGDPNRDYSAGATTRVYILVSAYRDNQFTDGILVHANQNGTLKDTAIPANSIDNSNIKSAAAIDGSKLANNSIDLGAKTSTWDGWILVSDTWTYASATTVTVPSDATTKYSVGDKVKFSNGSTKYFYITAVAATTITLNGGSDYTVANSAITSVYFSKAETPLSFPQWFNYTPTFAATTLGNGTVAGKFSMSGKTVNFRASFTLGSTSAVSSSPTVSFPVTSVSTYTTNQPIGSITMQDTAILNYWGMLAWSSTTVALFVVGTASGTYLSGDIIISSKPFSWGNTDILNCSGTYEAA